MALTCIISSTKVDKEQYLASLPQNSYVTNSSNPNFDYYRCNANDYILDALTYLQDNHKSIYDEIDNHFAKFYDLSMSASILSDIEGAKQYAAILITLMQPLPPNPIIIRQIENGLHPWLLAYVAKKLLLDSKFNDLNIIITTNSPMLINCLKPEQVAVAVEENKQVMIKPLNLDNEQFKAVYDAYDGDLGEMWYVNFFGGNPESVWIDK